MTKDILDALVTVAVLVMYAYLLYKLATCK